MIKRPVRQDQNTAAQTQSGQTLIETIIAIFLLTMALTSAVGLVIYALSTSTHNFNEIVATNLAREGVEVVRAMRDSNWLYADEKGGPWGLQPCADLGGLLCYPRAYEKVSGLNDYQIVDTSNHRVNFNSSTKTWSIDTSTSYQLVEQANGTYTHSGGSNWTFARRIYITRNNSAPYNSSNLNNQELIVTSVVAWKGKGCPDFATNANLQTMNTKCKIILQERLSNWKDYE